MKEGWKYETLEKLANLICDGDWIEKKDQSSSGIRLIQTGNIGVGVFKNKADNAHYITSETFSKLRCKELLPGDVLISRLPEPLGRSCILPDLSSKMITAVDCSIVRLKEEKISKKWFIYYTQSNGYLSIIKSQSSGTTRARITRKKLEKIVIPLPPLSEQEEIVTYLDTSFAKIDAIKANAEKELEEAKKLFAAALNEAMTPKDGWVEKTLGEIAEIKGGKRVPKGYKLSTEPTNHKYIRVADFNDSGSVDLSDIQYISDEVYEQIKKYTISCNDVYISIAGTIGKTGIIPEELDGANLTENACKLILNDYIYKYYLYYYTLADIFKLQIKKLTMTSAQPKLALTRLSTATISFPKTSDQQYIVTHLDTLSEKVRQLQSNYEKISSECDALKQAILRDTFE